MLAVLNGSGGPGLECACALAAGAIWRSALAVSHSWSQRVMLQRPNACDLRGSFHNGNVCPYVWHTV
eukprot:5599316-Prymnesium_polylepis.1